MKDIENIVRSLLKAFNKRRFRNLKFAVVSNNCWGGEVYEKYSKEYNTPFIGLFLKAPDYIRLVENFNYYINQEIIFCDNVNVDYPVGKLDDIEIYFMHYENRTIAKEKWDRRMNRFIKFSNDYPDKVFFKMCDREDGNLDILKRFHKTDHKNKISFCITEFDNQSNIVIRESDGNSVPDGKKLFYISLNYFDLHKWIKKNRLVKY